MSEAAASSRAPSSAALAIRSTLLWTLSALHFFPGALFFAALAATLPHRMWDSLFRAFARNIVRFAGARLVIRHAPGFDGSRPSIFVANHVNVFDPFVIYSAMPQFARGFEVDSHFKIPVYGAMMRRFGNVPVPSDPSAAALKRMLTAARDSLRAGTSLIAFPEGHRTRTGKVGPFEPGLLRIAIDLGVPVVPVSVDGSYAHFHVGDWRLHPVTIVVCLHGTIETAGMSRKDAPELAERTRAIVAAGLCPAVGLGTYREEFARRDGEQSS